MNVFWQELKFNKWSLLLWSMAIVLMIYFSYLKFAYMLTAERESMKLMLEKMPVIIRAIYGFNNLDITTITGYTALIINFLLPIIALHGLFLGMSHKRIEDKNKTLDFIYTKPMAKEHILRYKVLAGYCLLVIFNLILITATALIINYFASIEAEIVARAMISFFLSDIIFYALGLLIAINSKKKSYSGLALAFFFVFYVLSVIARLDKSVYFLAYFTPFEILSGTAVLLGFNPLMLVCLLIISLLMMVYSFKLVGKREVL